MNYLEVKNLTKKYQNFLLDDISFNIEENKITGFIGRNGAGKSTTIKSLLNLIEIDNGNINYNNINTKKEIGYSTGLINYYSKTKFIKIIKIIKEFYDNFDINEYNKYKELFEIDDNKTIEQMSQGMKVKCNLLIALSHKSKFLILDEPTSGLDPFSRDELLSLFIKLKNEGITILFSTHIIKDIEKCCDNILYIKNGKIIENCKKNEFKNKYKNNDIEEIILNIERSY